MRGRFKRRSRLFALAGALLLATLFAGTAYAHAAILSCTPSIGANLLAAPTELVCQFNEPLRLEGSSITVLNAQGQVVDRGDTRLAGNDATKLAVSLDAGKLGPGLYIVRWVVVSTVDLGVTQDQFQFGVNTVVPPTPTPELPGTAVTPQNFYSGGPTPNELIGRFLIGAGVAVLGAIGFVLWRTRRAGSAFVSEDEPGE